MRKLIFVLIATTLLLNSCLIDYNEKLHSPLNDTNWKHTEIKNESMTETTVVKFTDTRFEMVTSYIEKETSEVDIVTGTYTYEPPTIKLFARGKTLIGLIDGNSMTFDEGVFTQQ